MHISETRQNIFFKKYYIYEENASQLGLLDDFCRLEIDTLWGTKSWTLEWLIGKKHNDGDDDATLKQMQIAKFTMYVRAVPLYLLIALHPHIILQI